MDALGKMFATHCRQRSFDFDYTDVLAAKAQLFYDLGELGLKANIAIAMLVLGTDHNRWFVERKFLAMVAPTVSEALIQRVIVEMSVLGINFKAEYARVLASIGVETNAIHPQLEALIA